MVRQDALDRPAPDDVDRVLARGREDRLESGVLEGLEQEPPDRRLVVDDEDPASRPGGSSGPGARRGAATGRPRRRAGASPPGRRPPWAPGAPSPRRAP